MRNNVMWFILRNLGSYVDMWVILGSMNSYVDTRNHTAEYDFICPLMDL